MKKKFFTIIILFICLVSCTHQEPKIQQPEPKQKPKTTAILFGLDVSAYQGDIDWQTVAKQKKHPIRFVIVRATMGEKNKDDKFKYNFTNAKQLGFIVGAYHYYNPNHNSTDQANNYLKSVHLKKGDFVPIVDIEKLSNIQTKRNLRRGIKNWLSIVEKSYGVKPMIYTGLKFYKDHILDQEDFSGYPIWIAAYDAERRGDGIVCSADIHQFSECVIVPGISGCKVDGNDLKKENLESLLIK